MKKNIFLLLAFCVLNFAFCISASAQTRSNRIFRNCPATTTKAVVSLDTQGSITVQPCASPGTVTIGVSGGTTTINGTATISTSGALNLFRTITTGGTTGAQTINRPAGTVNVAAGQSSIVITNSLVTSSSIVFTTLRTLDATCTFVRAAVPTTSTVTITLNANCTAETSVGFLVTN